MWKTDSPPSSRSLSRSTRGHPHILVCLSACHSPSHSRGSQLDRRSHQGLYLRRRCRPWKSTPLRAYRGIPGSPGSAQPPQSALHPPQGRACTPPVSRTRRGAAGRSLIIRDCCHAQAVARQDACMEGLVWASRVARNKQSETERRKRPIVGTLIAHSGGPKQKGW